MFHTRLTPLLICLISLMALSAAYVAEYVLGWEPCPLCLWQRAPYFAAIPLGVWISLAPPKTARKLLVVLSAIFASGTALAIYHFGVEQEWWQALHSCSASTPDSSAPQEFIADLFARPKAPSCKDYKQIMYLSLAGWNAILSIMLFVVCVRYYRGKEIKTSRRLFS